MSYSDSRSSTLVAYNSKGSGRDDCRRCSRWASIRVRGSWKVSRRPAIRRPWLLDSSGWLAEKKRVQLMYGQRLAAEKIDGQSCWLKVESRFPLGDQKGQINVKFTWKDAFKPKVAGCTSYKMNQNEDSMKARAIFQYTVYEVVRSIRRMRGRGFWADKSPTGWCIASEHLEPRS